MRIEDQVRLQHWIEEEGDLARNVIKKANEKTRTGRLQKRHGLTNKMNKDGYKDLEWTNEDRIHTGLKLIDIIIEGISMLTIEREEIKNRLNKLDGNTLALIQDLKNY